MEENQAQTNESFLKELSEIKQRILNEVGNLSMLVKNNSEAANLASVELQDAKWYLGEERARREHLENELKAKVEQINTLEAQLHTVRANYSEAQWFLGEERAKRSHLENTVCGAQERCEALGEENAALRNKISRLEEEMKTTQWYLGEERAKREQSERSLQQIQSTLHPAP